MCNVLNIVHLPSSSMILLLPLQRYHISHINPRTTATAMENPQYRRVFLNNGLEMSKRPVDISTAKGLPV